MKRIFLTFLLALCAAGSSHAIDFELGIASIAGKLYKTDSDVAATTDACVGFAKDTVTRNSDIKVQLAGVMNGFTSLTTGSVYYLNAARGSIGTSAGTRVHVMGTATSATQLLITNIPALQS